MPSRTPEDRVRIIAEESIVETTSPQKTQEQQYVDLLVSIIKEDHRLPNGPSMTTAFTRGILALVSEFNTLDFTPWLSGKPYFEVIKKEFETLADQDFGR